MSCTNEQFLFLVIEQGGLGKVDYKAVADILGIKPGAAYMRYSRMKAKCGTFGDGKNVTDTAGDGGEHGDEGKQTPKKTPTKKPNQTPGSKGKGSKKRKLNEEVDDEAPEKGSPVKPEPEDEPFV